MHRRSRIKPPSSLRDKISILIVGTASILGVLAITIASILYIGRSDERYAELCLGTAKLAAWAIPGDSVDTYLETGQKDAAYYLAQEKLYRIRDSYPTVTYIYVYKIHEDGCHVVFDLTTDEVPAGELGDLVDFDASFPAEYKDELFRGEEFPPFTTNDTYGWLLTAYAPIYNGAGHCVAYAGADISMADIRADRFIFIIRLFSLLTGATILIVAFAIWFAQQQMVNPINTLANAASDFAFDKGRIPERAAEQLAEKNIRTGDEIENLSLALVKMMRDVVSYVDEISEKSRDVAAKAHLILQMQNNVILSFANMIENRDACTGNHVKHTASYVSAIGRAMRDAGMEQATLTGEYLSDLGRSAPLHDIGKIKIPDAILNKPGKLTPEEFDLIKTHTTAGRAILIEAVTGIEDASYLAQATDMATYHHERFDGTGYPSGLSGKEIPLCARIMAVADVFDALISKRSYKAALPFSDAVAIIESESGTHFDPEVVDAFLSVQSEIRVISEQ